MLLEKYGICLRRMQIEDCELVRKWRNDDKISRFMFHQGSIQSEMQINWFHSINNSSNFFFLILKNNEPIGLINTSSIDWEAGTAYTGLFVYEDQYLASEVPVYASLNMLDFFLGPMGLQFIYAKVRGNNRRAHLYNSTLGFRRTKKIELGLGYEYLLRPNEYFTKADALRKFGAKRFGATTRVTLNPNDPADHLILNKLKENNPRDHVIQMI